MGVCKDAWVLGFRILGLTCSIGGPWNSVTFYSWAYKPNYDAPKKRYRGYQNCL